MIDRIGNGAAGRLDTGRLQSAQRARPAGAVMTDDVAAQAPASPAAELAAAGPPVDGGKVAALRARIASGSYTIDADAIADRMIALDLPGVTA